MSEFIREVDEEYRQEQIRSLLGRYWIAILAFAIAVLIGVGGWRGYVYYRQQQAEAAGTRYFDATQLGHDDSKASISALDLLAKDAPSGYQMLSRFRAAAVIGSSDVAAGAKAFDALADDQSIGADLRDVAKMRAALLVMNSADPAEIARRFEPLADSNAPFRNIAREMLAVTALKRGDDAAAKGWLDAEMTDPTTAQDQRQRTGLLLSLIRSGKPGEVAPATPPALSAPPTEAVAPTRPAPDAPIATPPSTDQPPAVKP